MNEEDSNMFSELSGHSGGNKYKSMAHDLHTCVHTHVHTHTLYIGGIASESVCSAGLPQ